MASTVNDVIDSFSTSLAVKAPVRVATTANITLSGLQTVNSVGVVAGDRVLVKNQTDATENGIYVVSSSAWSRASDFDGNRDVIKGTVVLLQGGGSYTVTTDDPITIGTSSISFVASSDADLEAALANDSDAGLGSALIGHYDPIAPTYLKTVSDIINGEEVSALRFIATGSHAAIRAHTSTTDLATSFSDIANSGARGIYFPYGQYQKNSATTPPSNQRWRGDGRGNTVIQMPQSNQTLNYNFLDNGSSDLSNFAMIDLTLKGSLPYQTNAASAGKGFAFWSRGAVNNVHFVRVEVTQFGDQSNTGGGGIILGHPTTSTTTGKASRGIKFLHCTFDTNANVCGLYLSQGGDGGTYDVEIIGNFFNGGYSSGTAQNCVYILGADASRVIDTLTMTGNRFRIANSIDQCVEFNWVKNFTVSNNPCRVLSGVSTCSGHILLRDGCIGGTVTNNPMRDDSGNAVAGIALVRFASPGTGTQENITIGESPITGFDRGLQVDSGSINVTATGLTIRSCGEGVRLAACTDVNVFEAEMRDCGYAAVFAGGAAGMRRIKVKRCETYNATLGVFTTINADGPDGDILPDPEDIQHAEFEDNVDVGSAGASVITWFTAAATGNKWLNNRSTIATQINPSYLPAIVGAAYWEQIKIPDLGIGADVGNAATTVYAGISNPVIVYATPITADRAVALSTIGAWKGAKHRILRKASCTGAFNVNVGTGPLKALATAGSWCDVEYDGSAWALTGYGTL